MRSDPSMPRHHFFEQTPEDNRLNYAENVREEYKAFLSQQHHKKGCFSHRLVTHSRFSQQRRLIVYLRMLGTGDFAAE
jgi:hypothetical protein